MLVEEDDSEGHLEDHLVDHLVDSGSLFSLTSGLMIRGNWYWGILIKVAWLMQCSTRSANTLYANHELKIIPTTPAQHFCILLDWYFDCCC